MKQFLFIVTSVIAAVLVFYAEGSETPSSDRSRTAITKVKPGLERSLEAKGLQYGDPVFIRVFKEPKKLEVWIKKGEKFELFRTYNICYYSGDLGPKLKEGDMQSPEGFYYVAPDKLNPNSQYHLSFDIGFPNAYDRAHKRTGSLIMIHGNCVSIGCYAMRDKKIEEIYALVNAALSNGQPIVRVHVFPFRMTKEKMLQYLWSPWYSFWSNLKEGYDFFEKNHRPPNVLVKNKKYLFEK